MNGTGKHWSVSPTTWYVLVVVTGAALLLSFQISGCRGELKSVADFWKLSEAILHCFAFVIGAVWAYGKFVRGREHEWNVFVAFDLKSHSINGNDESRLVAVDVTLENRSETQVILDEVLIRIQKVVVDQEAKSGVISSVEPNGDKWHDVNVLTTNYKPGTPYRIEPKATYHESVSVLVSEIGLYFVKVYLSAATEDDSISEIRVFNVE